MRYTQAVLEDVIKNSSCLYEAVKKLGVKRYGGGIYYHLRKKIKEFNIDTSHFVQTTKTGRNNKKVHWSKRLIYSQDRIKSKDLRKALIESGREYKCVSCGNNGYWLGKVLILEVDHIDCNCLNNIPCNLQFLCSNCHTIKTYNNYGHPLIQKEKIKKDYVYKPRPKARKYDRPSKEDLYNLVWSKPTVFLSKELGVSDKCIEKWCKVYGIDKPPKGYWQKVNKNKKYMGL